MKKETILFPTYEKFVEYLDSTQPMPLGKNRAVTSKHVDKLKVSLLEVGWLGQPVIAVTKALSGSGEVERYRIDGNHSIVAFQQVPKETFKDSRNFSVLEVSSDRLDRILKVEALLNSAQKNWGLQTYLDVGVSLGLPDYLFVRDKVNSTNLRPNAIIEAYLGYKDWGNTEFKNLRFRANKREGNRIIRTYEEAVDNGLYRKSSSALAVIRFLSANRDLNISRFLEGISQNREIFSQDMQRDYYEKMFKRYCI